MKAKLVACLIVTGVLAAAPTGRSELLQVLGIRHWTSAGATRVAIEVSGDFTYRTERLHNPERVFYDILKSRPNLESRRFLNKELADPILKRIRVAETVPGVTRVVLDLQSSPEVSVSQLSNPNRLVIELRSGRVEPPASTPPSPAPTTTSSASKPVEAPVAAAVVPESAPRTVIPKPPETTPAPRAAAAPASTPPVVKESIERSISKTEAEVTAEPSKAQTTARTTRKPAVPTPEIAKPPADAPATEAARPGTAARRTSNGGSSLTRALGLKITRVVIDPGHGGHDHGTSGAKGLTEKELVLDLALRVGKLIESRLGAEVVYTRSTDSFVPLEGRTAIANEKKADLFLSIHANSSAITKISGVETYYLNFTDSRDALDVASRENAASQKSVFELRDIIQKITLHEKVEESREFAAKMQAALFSFSARTLPGSRNRGVKKAPFVVLIGARMPSILAEVGFLSNPREEALLKKSEHREKLAEALFRGISKYADGLSHFQLAASSERETKTSVPAPE